MRIAPRLAAMAILACIAAAAPAPPSWAAASGTLAYGRALDLYRTGDFRQAARLAASTRSSDGLTLAARALLARAAELEPLGERLALYRRAEDLARDAIALDEKNAEAYRMLAISLGFIARTQSPVENWLRGYADEAKALLDRALALEPSSPWGHAAKGAWHAEVVAAAGDMLADRMIGASLDQAQSSFRRAIDLDPTNPVLHYEFAVALIRTRQSRFYGLIRQQISLAALMHPNDAYEAMIVRRARALNAKAKSGGFDALLEDAFPAAEPHDEPKAHR